MNSRHVAAELIKVWSPIPGSSQAFAMDSRCHHTLYCGSRGPGKSDTQLMRFRRNVGVGYGPFWRGIIFDREYKNLDDLVQKSLRWFHAFEDGAKWLSSAKDYKWVWATGEELLFRAIDKLSDYNNFHGHEYPFIGWNELCKYPTSDLYEMMMSVNRTSFTPEKDTPIEMRKQGKLMKPIPLEVFSTTNPYGAGHGWVKRRFIDPKPFGHIVRTTVEVFNPVSKQREPVTKTQVAIFGTYKENIYLPVAYIAELEKDSDKTRKEAWLHGNWDIVAGGAVSDVWDKSAHVIPPFKIPGTWYVNRTFDWGSTKPFCCTWFAEANGETATLPDGRKWTPYPGSLIVLFDYYGCGEPGKNVGIKLPSSEVADNILEIEKELLRKGIIPYPAFPGPADNQIRDVRESDVDTIEKKMEDHHVHWTESDKSPGSRKIGLELTRDMLVASRDKKEEPGLYFFNCAAASLATIPTLPRDEDKLDDVDSDAEDHPYDCLRYRVLEGSNRIATSLKVGHPR